MLGLSGRQECLDLNGALIHWLEPANFFALRPDGDLIAVSSKTLELLRPSTTRLRFPLSWLRRRSHGRVRTSQISPTSFRREEQRFLASGRGERLFDLASFCLRFRDRLSGGLTGIAAAASCV
jgi:hypothetical protein